MTTPDQPRRVGRGLEQTNAAPVAEARQEPDVAGRDVAERIRGLANDLEGSTPRPGAVPDLPEVIAQLRRYAEAAEQRPGNRHATYIALRATNLAARLNTPFHRAKAATLGGRVLAVHANQNHAALAAVAQGDFGPGEGLDEAGAETRANLAPRIAAESIPSPPSTAFSQPSATPTTETARPYQRASTTANRRSP